ncbi:MAG: hypothetical protein WBJ37_04450 [Bacteroidales bacterium]
MTLLTLVAVLHLYVAEHYCGGIFVASKVSFTGNLASCGMSCMEEGINETGQAEHLKTHCCDDYRTLLSVANDYKPTNNTYKIFFSFKPVLFPALLIRTRQPESEIYHNHIKPPGYFSINDVNLNDICVLRI